MQKIILFIEPNKEAWLTLSKIGSLFINRFAIEEDEKFEIVKICQLNSNFDDFVGGYLNSDEGKGLIII